jgi:hypothetical protein
MTNLLILEVKPANADLGRMIDDLKKLTRFRRDLKDQNGQPGNYHAAYFWLYGLSVDEWTLFRGRLLRGVEGTEEFDLSLVSCFIHPRAGDRALQVSWR